MGHAIPKCYAPFSSPNIFKDHVKYVELIKDEIWCMPFCKVSKYIQERGKAVKKLQVPEHSISDTDMYS